MYAAPLIAVGYSGALMQLQLVVEAARKRSEDNAARRTVRTARTTITELLNKSDTSAAHKRDLRTMLEQIDKEDANRHLSRVQALK